MSKTYRIREKIVRRGKGSTRRREKRKTRFAELGAMRASYDPKRYGIQEHVLRI